jgi:hypothetical protein
MTVFSCHDPAGVAVGHRGWSTVRTADLFMTVADTCADSNQGAMSLDLGTNPGGYGNGAAVMSIFSTESWGSIAEYTIHIAGSYASPSTGQGSGQVFVNASDETDPIYDLRNLGGGSRGSFTVTRTPPTSVSAIAVNASCDGQGGPCPANTAIAHVDMTSAALVLNDYTAPEASDITGSLANTTPIQGTGEITFHATDDGPGIYNAWLIIDGTPQTPVLVNTNNGLCRNLGETTDGTRSFAAPEPCAKATSGSVTLDTTRLTDGPHTVKLMIDDAAGDADTAYVGTITTHNASSASQGAQPGPGSNSGSGSAPSGTPNGAGASEAAHLSLGTNETITRRYSRRAITVSGRLQDGQGHPIADATLDVLQRILGAATTTVLAHATTRVDGTFSVRVPAGASRLLQIGYRAYSGDTDYDALRSIRETVTAGVSLHISRTHTGPNGTIVLSGKVEGPIPPQGTIVHLLVHYRGRWVPFRTPQTKHDGSFSRVYEFEGSIGRFPFRANVPGGQAGFPFAGGESRIIDVTTS